MENRAMKIVTGRSMFGVDIESYWKGPIWSTVANRRSIPKPSLKNPMAAVPVYAHISHGRLLAMCPNCNNAEYVWPDKLLMYCAECGNADVKNYIRRVVLPVEYDAICKELLKRTNPANQSWFPDETLESLVAERKAQAQAHEQEVLA